MPRPAKKKPPKPEDVIAGKQKEPKETEAEMRKRIISEERNRLEKEAKKIALKTMTELQLVTQVELSTPQKEAAKLLANGMTIEEVCNKLAITFAQIEIWMSEPSFVRLLNEKTIKDGLGDKNERIRRIKRIAESFLDRLLSQIESGKFDELGPTTIADLAMRWEERLNRVMSEDKETDAGKKDLTVLILQHVQGQNGKKFDKLEDFLTAPEFQYPVIDAEFHEVTPKQIEAPKNDATN